MTSILWKKLGGGLRACAMLSLLAPLAHATITFTLNPSNGQVSGTAGQTVGWGFTIADSADWLIVAGTGFCTTFNTSTDSLPCLNPVPSGTYTDFTSFNFVLSAPNSADTSQQTFNAVSHFGTGSFQIAGNAPLGPLSGFIVVEYFLFNGDPTNGGSQIGGDNFVTAPASVQVITPEPNAGVLTLIGGSIILLVGRRLGAKRPV
jgi:hypothetical protein